MTERAAANPPPVLPPTPKPETRPLTRAFQQATKLLQLKKATLNDIEIIQDICWM